jgi:ketosteroid isomerase-like protein
LDRVDEYVDKVLDALNARDADRMRRLLHPEVEFVSLLGAVDGQSYRGLKAVDRYFADLADTFETVQWELLAVEEGTHGRPVVALEMRGRGRASGVEIRLTSWQVWTMRDGLLIRSVVYTDRDEALRAADDSE